MRLPDSQGGAPTAARAVVLQQLADLVTAVERPHPVRVAIDGPDAAGKTTLADELAGPVAAGGRAVIRASVDDFHRPRAERYRRGELSGDGCWLDSFDYPALRAELLDPLGPGGDRRYRTAVFDSFNDRPVDQPALVASAGAVLLLDGVFLLRPELAGAFELAVFVDASEQEILRRAVGRDLALLGGAETVLDRYRRRYLPGQRRYDAAVGPRGLADVVVDNTDPRRPRARRGPRPAR